MKKNKKKNNHLPTVNYNVLSLQNNYIDEIKTNLDYSLEIDPYHKYNFTPDQIEFIRNYIQFKNVATAAELSKIDVDKGKEYFLNYNIQKEIRRIHSALYQRQFCSKLLSLDQMGGYLTSLLTDSNVPIADRLTSSEKLKVIDIMLKITEMKAEGMAQPEIIIEKDLDEQIKDLSVDTIKHLLEQKSDKNKKQEMISKMDKDSTLSLEEKSYLQTLPTSELLKILNEINKGENKNE